MVGNPAGTPVTQVKDGTLRTFNPDGRTVERSVEYKDSKPVAE